MGTVSADRKPSLLGSFGAWLLLFGAVCGILTVFSALVPWEIGVWPRFEAGGMALFFASGVCGLALFLTWFHDRSVVESALSHPVVMAAFLIAFSGSLFAIFADYPWLSIFGYPLIGEGTLRYAAMGVLFAAAIVLRRDPLRFRILLVCLLAGSIGGTLAVFTWARDAFVSLDILGLLVIPAGVGAWCLIPARLEMWRFTICLAAVAPILMLSNSATAILVTLAIALPAAALIQFNLRRPVISDRSMRVLAALAVVAIPVAGLLAAWWIPALTDTLESVTSRKFTYQTSFSALDADPMVALIGQGWGEVVMTLDRFRLLNDAVLWDGSWDGATRDLPHTHSHILEALFGGGIIAVLGVLALLMAPVLTCDRRDLPVTVFAVAAPLGIRRVGKLQPERLGREVVVARAVVVEPPFRVTHEIEGTGGLVPVAILAQFGKADDVQVVGIDHVVQIVGIFDLRDEFPVGVFEAGSVKDKGCQREDMHQDTFPGHRPEHHFRMAREELTIAQIDTAQGMDVVQCHANEIAR